MTLGRSRFGAWRIFFAGYPYVGGNLANGERSVIFFQYRADFNFLLVFSFYVYIRIPQQYPEQIWRTRFG